MRGSEPSSAGGMEVVHGVALEPPDLNGLPVEAVHDAGALAQHLDGARARTTAAQDVGLENETGGPRTLPLAIRLMNPGTSMCVGQAPMQGASKQSRHRLASITAACGTSGGLSSLNRSRSSGSSGRLPSSCRPQKDVLFAFPFSETGDTHNFSE